MDRSTCENLLDAQYSKNPYLADNISKITTLSRGIDKSTCLQLMGSVSGVKNFLFKRSQYTKDMINAPQTLPTQEQTNTSKTETTTATTTQFNFSEML
ncbi:TPA: hypothetical protein DEP21_06305 [Patescibacteria group bacterium]|nr:hypothetical protein [Candidatus Gracilibacteria bacterium]